jgi:hypothetical protein
VIKTDITTPIVTHEDRLNVDEGFFRLKKTPAGVQSHCGGLV